MVFGVVWGKIQNCKTILGLYHQNGLKMESNYHNELVNKVFIKMCDF